MGAGKAKRKAEMPRRCRPDAAGPAGREAERKDEGERRSGHRAEPGNEREIEGAEPGKTAPTRRKMEGLGAGNGKDDEGSPGEREGGRETGNTLRATHFREQLLTDVRDVRLRARTIYT